MLVSVGEQTSVAPAESWRKALLGLWTFMTSYYWWWHPSAVFLLSECAIKPQMLIVLFSSNSALVHRPTRNSPGLFARNQTITNPFQPSLGDACQCYSHRSCLYWTRCLPLEWDSWIHKTELLVNSLQSVPEIDFKPCRINMKFFS